MKLYTLRHRRQTIVAAELDGGFVKLPFADMLELLRGGKAALALAKKTRAKATSRALIAPSKAKLMAPIPRPGKIWCSGLNYHGHLVENPRAKLLSNPRFFSKLPQCVIGPGAPILHPGERFEVDWEVELAVVIGKSAYRLTPKNALDHVFGYSILHDVSARYIQFKDNNEQIGKNFETFSPLGPCLVTRDEIPEPEKCRLTLKVNGVTKQDFTNEDWVFPLPRLLEWVSMGARLEPGDVVTTGTGRGVGAFATPPCFLRPGDVTELEVSGIGKLINPVKLDPYVFSTQPSS